MPLLSHLLKAATSLKVPPLLYNEVTHPLKRKRDLQRQSYTATVTRSVMLSEPTQTKHIEFAVQELKRFDFIPGQFVSMTAPRNGKTMTRAYSLASGPRGNNQFDLCLNRVSDGFFSNLLCDLKEGDTIAF